VDERGAAMTGDQVLIVCAKMLKDEGRLKNDLIVSTVMSNMGLLAACEKLGMKHEASAVGDRNVLEAMQRTGAMLGGEESGHTIFLEHHTTGDGILTAVQLLAAMNKAGKPMSELAGLMEVFPQKLVNVEVTSKPGLDTIPEIITAIRRAEAELGSDGRVLVRYSGTESKCRVMVEAPTAGLAQSHAERIAGVVRSTIG
jgi:phosphoglucosamine mutase